MTRSAIGTRPGSRQDASARTGLRERARLPLSDGTGLHDASVGENDSSSTGELALRVRHVRARARARLGPAHHPAPRPAGRESVISRLRTGFSRLLSRLSGTATQLDEVVVGEPRNRGDGLDPAFQAIQELEKARTARPQASGVGWRQQRAEPAGAQDLEVWRERASEPTDRGIADSRSLSTGRRDA